MLATPDQNHSKSVRALSAHTLHSPQQKINPAQSDSLTNNTLPRQTTPNESAHSVSQTQNTLEDNPTPTQLSSTQPHTTHSTSARAHRCNEIQTPHCNAKYMWRSDVNNMTDIIYQQCASLSGGIATQPSTNPTHT